MGRDGLDDESRLEDEAFSDDGNSDEAAGPDDAAGLDEGWAERDWELPASAFRPDPHAQADDPAPDLPPDLPVDLPDEPPIDTTGVAAADRGRDVADHPVPGSTISRIRYRCRSVWWSRRNPCSGIPIPPAN